MPQSKFVSTNGLRLHYLDYGTAAKPTLICVHGLTGNAHNFDALGPLLAARYHTLSLDVRGRGDSQWGPGDQYDAPHYVADLAAMLEVLRIERVTLVGTSMGGIISMLFSSMYPARVERLVLNDIGPEIDPAGLKRISAYVGTSPDEFPDLPAVVAYYRENYPPMASMADAVLSEMVKWSVKPTGRGTLAWKMDPAVRAPMRQPTGAATNMWEAYGKITAPTLILRGAESDVLSRATTARMCQVSRAHAVEVPGVGHAPSLSEPEAMAALREFLKL